MSKQQELKFNLELLWSEDDGTSIYTMRSRYYRNKWPDHEVIYGRQK